MDENYGADLFQEKLSSIRQTVEYLGRKGVELAALREIGTQVEALQKLSQGMPDLPQDAKLLKGIVATLRKENAHLKKVEKFASQMEPIQAQLAALQQESAKLQQERDSLRQENERLRRALESLQSRGGKPKEAGGHKGNVLRDEEALFLDDAPGFHDEDDVLLIGQDVVPPLSTSTPLDTSKLTTMSKDTHSPVGDDDFIAEEQEETKLLTIGPPKKQEKPDTVPGTSPHPKQTSDPKITAVLPVISRREGAKSKTSQVEEVPMSEDEILRFLQIEKSGLDNMIQAGKLRPSISKEGKRQFSRKEAEQIRKGMMESDTVAVKEDKHKRAIGRLKQLYRDHIDNDPQD